jgi:tetratricopeptide (TPR) repeat protein
MINTLDEYISEFRKKLNTNIFSPYFSRLANLYFLNGQYEDCINTCKTGLELYPDYQTAKLLMLKGLIKLEYINEAEILIDELEEKYQSYEILITYRKTISELKTISKQERIYYTQRISPVVNFEEFRKYIEQFVNDKTEYNTDTLITQIIEERDKSEKEINFNKFKTLVDSFIFEESDNNIKDFNSKPEVTKQKETSETLHFLKIKIMTETFADLLAQQGYIKEAFNGYNQLLKNEDANKDRLMEKLTELERSLIVKDKSE